MSSASAATNDSLSTSQPYEAPGINFGFEGLDLGLDASDSPLPTSERVLCSKDSGTEAVEGTDVTGLEFELHYGLSAQKAIELLDEILTDMVSHNPVHDWDAKIAPDAVKVLAATARKCLNSDPHGHSLGLNTLIAYSTVEEILLVGGINERLAPTKDADDIASHVFFTKVSRGHFLLEHA